MLTRREVALMLGALTGWAIAGPAIDWIAGRAGPAAVVVVGLAGVAALVACVRRPR